MARHLQYSGIFIAVLGQLIHWLTIPTLVLFSLIVWAYYRLSRLEEQQMCDRYGQKYAIYQWQASVFIPK